jgi:Protein of unknown function (DUF2442)
MAKTAHLSQKAYEKALADTTNRPGSPWAVEAVEYDDKKNAIALRLLSGACHTVPVAHIREFAGVTPAELQEVYLSPAKETLCLDAADAHISINGLIRDVFAR